MGAEYTRQSAAEIVDGEVAEASDFNNEFNQIEAFAAASTGHTHDGTTGEGGPVTKLLGTAITIGDGTAATDIVITVNGETNDGVITWMEDEDYFKIQDDVVINSTERLYLFDQGGEYLSGDGTNLTITSGGAINLTATTDVVVPANVGVTFGTGEKIEGDNTDLTVTSGADINLTATADVNIPANVGVTFGDDGEKIEGDGTNLTVSSSNNLTLDATGDIILDADGADVTLKDAGTTYAALTNATGELAIKSGATPTTAVTFSGANADFAGTLDVTGATTLDSTLDVKGNVTIGDDATDTLTVTADVASNLIPSGDDTYDLGATGSEWKDIYIDGVAYVDSIAMPTTTVTDILDEDTMSSDSDTALATQQSIKAYVDAEIAGVGTTNTFGANIIFEGATEDDFETTFAVTDPTADNTITLPDATGNVIIDSKAQEFTKTQNFNATTLTDAATIAWDASSNQVTSVELGGNRTFGAPTNLIDGGVYVLMVKQDVTGSRTGTWNAVFKWTAGSTPTLTTTASAKDIFTFLSDGTNLYEIGRSLNA